MRRVSVFWNLLLFCLMIPKGVSAEVPASAPSDEICTLSSELAPDSSNDYFSMWEIKGVVASVVTPKIFDSNFKNNILAANPLPSVTIGFQFLSTISSPLRLCALPAVFDGKSFKALGAAGSSSCLMSSCFTINAYTTATVSKVLTSDTLQAIESQFALNSTEFSLMTSYASLSTSVAGLSRIYFILVVAPGQIIPSGLFLKMGSDTVSGANETFFGTLKIVPYPESPYGDLYEPNATYERMNP